MQSSGTGAAEVEQLDFLSRLEREADRTDPSSSSRQVRLHSENRKHNVVHVMKMCACSESEDEEPDGFHPPPETTHSSSRQVPYLYSENIKHNVIHVVNNMYL